MSRLSVTAIIVNSLWIALCMIGAYLLALREAREGTRRMIAHVLDRAASLAVVDALTARALDAAFLHCERGGCDADLTDMLQDSRRAQAAAKIARLRSATVAPTHPSASVSYTWPRGAVGLLLCALACALPLAAQDEPRASDQVSMGAAAVVQDDATLVPAAIIGVDFPVYLGHSPVLRAYTLLAIDGAAGETLTPGDVRTFRALRFDAWLQRRVGSDDEGGSTYLAAHVGGAARLDTAGREPFVRAPLWWSAGLVFERRAGENFPHRRAALGFGHSDLSSPPRRVPGSLRAAIRDSAPRDLIVSGHVTVTALETAGGAAVKVIISASLHRALWGTRGTTAAIVSTTITWGRAS